MGDENTSKILYQTVYDGKGANEAKQGLKDVGNEAENTDNKLKGLVDTGKWAILGHAIKKMAGYMSDAVKKSADYIETLNVLEVAFDGNTESIRRFSSTLADTLNLDDSTIISSAAHFKVLTQSMGIATETGEKLSELMTKMTLDLSSLYNMDFDKAQTALQYAMEGRGTSLKQRTGVSVLETSVQTTMDVLGIDAYVEDMNDAEKALARVISMEYQLMSSQGDLARTIEAPANQMRIMGEQISMLARNIGNVLLPVVAKILPYFNAILIVLNAIISALARLVGYKEGMFDTFEEANTIDYFDGVGSAIDGVGKSAESTAKKLQGLRGFDKLNVIKSPTDTGSSGGGAGGAGGAGGINPNLLKAFNDMADQYKMKLESVKTKAQEIAEKILDWLGFTKKVNEETGKIEWVFEKIKAGTIIGIIVSLLTGYTIIQKISGVLAKIGLISKPLPELFKVLGTLFAPIKKLVIAIGEGFQLWIGGAGTLGEVFVDIILPALGSVLALIGGIIGIVGGIIRTFQGIADLITDVENKFGAVMKIIEGIALIVGGIALLLGAWPVAIIAGIVALVAFIAEVISNNWEAISKFFTDIWQGFYDTVIAPVVNFITTIADFIYKNVIKPVIDFFKPIFDAVISIKKLIIDNVISIASGIINAVVTIFLKVFEIVAKIVEIVIALGKAAYDYVIKPVIGWVGKAFKFFYDNAIKPIIDIFAKVGSWVYDHLIAPIWDKILWLRDKAVNIFKAIGTTVVNFIGGSVKAVINGIFSSIESGINFFIRMLNKAIKLINKIPGVDIGYVRELSIPRLANGGMPEVGQMFIANERGPELVGQIGGKSFVANQNQMLDLIDKKLQKSGGLQNATFIIQVGDEQVAKKVLKDLNGMAKSNGKPITIGG